MLFKFRQRVKVKASIGKVLRPDGMPSQAEFFEGQAGAVIRFDGQKGGYLVVMDCPEISAAMGETITAYFPEYELDADIQSPPSESALYAQRNAQALPGPFEYPPDRAPLSKKARKAWSADA